MMEKAFQKLRQAMSQMSQMKLSYQSIDQINHAFRTLENTDRLLLQYYLDDVGAKKFLDRLKEKSNIQN
jgi:hypothetical protein